METARRNIRAAAAIVLVIIAAVVLLASSSIGSEANARVDRYQAAALSAASAKDTVVAVGDIACPASEPVTPTSCAHSAVAERISRIDPAAVLLLGDVQYNAGSLEDFRASFEKSWRALRQRWRPAVGNHEYGTPGAQGYFKFFGQKAGNARGNYSFDVAGWHFIALNSNCAIVACTASSPQGRWLAKDLARNAQKKCVAAFWHAPLFSSGGKHGNNSSVKPFWNQLRKARAEIILNGHDHDYERFAPQDQNAKADPNGIREFVAGSGGRSHYAFGKRQPNSQVRISGHFGALSLKLSSRGYRWKFANTSGAVLDRGARRCR